MSDEIQTVDGDNGTRERAKTVAWRRHGGPAKKSTWTSEEDTLLMELVRRYDAKNWRFIAEHFTNRTYTQCLHRWRKVLDPRLIKGAWTPEEDNLLINLIKRHRCHNWSVIQQSMTGRIGKQCRERWHNHLNPTIKTGSWSQEEEATLVDAHKKYGNKWAQICTLLPGRSPNSIKNYWNCSIKKRYGDVMPDRMADCSSIGLNINEPKANCQESKPVTESNGLPEQKPILFEQIYGNRQLYWQTAKRAVTESNELLEQEVTLFEQIYRNRQFFRQTTLPDEWLGANAVESDNLDTRSIENESDSENYLVSSETVSVDPSIETSLVEDPTFMEAESQLVSSNSIFSRSFSPSIVRSMNRSRRTGMHYTKKFSQACYSRERDRDVETWSSEEFRNLSRDFLQLGTSYSSESTKRSLQAALDKVWDGSPRK